MPDEDIYVQMAHEINPLREPILRSAIRALRLPSGSRGLDAGCGIGLQALLLAEFVGSAGIAPFVEGKKPEAHFLRALGWLRDAGLENPTAQTFVGDAHAPLRDDHRRALQALFQMRWPGVESELSQENWADYQRLCLPESPDFILDHPDYYAFFTYSMFHGYVTEGG